MNQNNIDNYKRQMIEALQESNGVVTTAIQSVKMNRSTFYKWMNEDEEFKKEVDDIRESALDYVESKMFERITNGSDTMIIFFLKTQGKKRGYIERSQLDVQNTSPDFSGLSTDDIINLLNENDTKSID
jgi:hypothetical protein